MRTVLLDTARVEVGALLSVVAVASVGFACGSSDPPATASTTAVASGGGSGGNALPASGGDPDDEGRETGGGGRISNQAGSGPGPELDAGLGGGAADDADG